MESLFDYQPLKMPAEYFGAHKTSGGYTKSVPREWTEKEVEWILEKKKEGYSNSAIADAIERTEVSVQIKLKRLTKTGDSYNAKHRDLKYQSNQQFLDLVQPKKVLDVYAGNSWWESNVETCWTNDTDESFDCDYKLDALELLCRMYAEGEKFDLIDLDPYGSAYECFDLAIKMSKKGIVVSFGEWGHKRWKRTDFVKPRYGIESVEDFADGEPFVKELQRIAACNKKQATPKIAIQYGNFFRVYFELTTKKVTEQWEKSDQSDNQ